MALRECVLIALLAVTNSMQRESDDVCARMCPNRQLECPSPCPACPSPQSPAPICPSLPPTTATPCPSLPEIPACPAPVVTLSCPSCPSCPACPPAPETPLQLPQGYRAVPGLGTYRISTNRDTWENSHSVCSEDGGYLVIPNTREELTHLIMMMFVNGVSIVHIGFHRVGTTDEFVTTLGTPLDAEQQTFWDSDQPSNNSERLCTYLHRYSRTLRTEECSVNANYMCEI